MKKIFLLSIAFFLVLFLGYKETRAQGVPTPSAQTVKPISRCLKVEPCSSANPKCLVGTGHTARLSTDPKEPALEANKKTYITECFSYAKTAGTAATNICTTGNPQLDVELFGVDNLTKIQADIGQSFTKEENGGVYIVQTGTAQKLDPPTTVQTDGKSNIPKMEWNDYTPVGRERRWLAYQLINVTPAIRTKEGGEQQATLDFLADPAVCAPLAWDPDGRVFDAVTLDPIPGATVTLTKRYATGFQNALQSEKIVNPQFTVEDGKFSFIVTDGDYKLSVVAPGYVFPVTDITKVNANYSKIYVNPDAYPIAPTPVLPNAPKTKIYPAQTGEILTVAGRPQHGDIPLNPSKVTGFEHKKVVITSFVEQRLLSGNMSIQGELSHPFAKITVYVVDKNSTSSVSTPLPTAYKADRNGRFNFVLDQKTLTAGKIFDHITFEAVDLTGPLSKKGSFLKQLWTLIWPAFGAVQAQQTSQQTSVKLNQIPAYLEGYAYDSSGKVVPNATVGVYLTFSTKPSYEAKTDENGFFKLTSEFLPNMPYSIRYTSATGAVVSTITPETFITQNAKYLADNKINLYGYKDVKGGTTPPPFFMNSAGRQGAQAGGAVVPTTAANPLVGAAQSNNGLMTTLIILLLLVGVLGLIVGIYLLKKNQQVPPTVS